MTWTKKYGEPDIPGSTRFMNIRKVVFLFFAVVFLFTTGCTENPLVKREIVPVALKDVAAERLSYRYEPDVPAPDPKFSQKAPTFERSEAVQQDFDTNRPLDMLERTLQSPDNSRILVVYRDAQDIVSDFHLDMYSKDGKLIRKITHSEMAVQFPDTIVWSPDGNNVAFVAKVRGAASNELGPDASSNGKPVSAATPGIVDLDGEEKTDETEKAAEPAKPAPAGVEAAKDVLTFRTEQIYICNADGGDVKPLTKVEGLMYFYFVWSPDSAALAALAAVHTEWRIFEKFSKDAGQVFVPRGRPRIIEKNGRERKLDDEVTAVHPVWSPDSAKVAVAFDKQIRIYDGIRNQPTQAAIPLKNDLLLSSRAYEKQMKEKSLDLNANETGNGPAEEKVEDSNSNGAKPQFESALPDPNLLVSFNPIVNLVWVEDNLLYFETGFVRNFLDQTENVRSYMRWHRLILSAQPTSLPAQKQ